MDTVTSSITDTSMFSPPLPPTAICDLPKSVCDVLSSGSLSIAANCRNGVLM